MDDKTKQVQVRLTPELHSRLKGTLALEGRKLVDFFNEAAMAYLTDSIRYKTTIAEITEQDNPQSHRNEEANGEIHPDTRYNK